MRREADRAAPAPRRPIVILGVSRRSGTNLLAGLLLCHRDCSAPGPPVAEDHLLADVADLERYVRATSRRWPHRWGDRSAGAERLRHSLGEGLVGFLASSAEVGPATRIVTRTPSVVNLGSAAEFLPGADLVLLVRDGRSVVASFVEAWGWPFDLAVAEWRRGAREILDFRRATESPSLLVRFEDAVRDVDCVVDDLLAFTGLDPTRFDRDAAHRMPVLGSSFERDDRGRVTWEPRDSSDEFDPTVRFGHWSAADHARYAWLAGEEHEALGYELDGPRPAGRAAVEMRLADLVSPLRTTSWRLRRHAANTYRRRRADRRARRSHA